MHGAHTTPALDLVREQFAQDVVEYLQRSPRQLPSRYFYDPLGTALFEAICCLPWYRITRAESSLLDQFSRDILRPLRRPLNLAELGCGSGDKLGTLIERSDEPIRLVQLVDISAAALQKARDRLAPLLVDDLMSHEGTYEEGLNRIESHRTGDGSLLVLFLGSNIGNFDRPAAHDLLVRIRGCLRPGDAFLLGADLVKPERELLHAYDDPLQVTAAFNRNLLRRINDELGGTFDLDGFGHRAVWNREQGRVEMHLVSLRRQTVRVADSLDLTLNPDEWIWTESSYKYQPPEILRLGQAAGFAQGEQWIDRSAGFALTRFSV